MPRTGLRTLCRHQIDGVRSCLWLSVARLLRRTQRLWWLTLRGNLKRCDCVSPLALKMRDVAVDAFDRHVKSVNDLKAVVSLEFGHTIRKREEVLTKISEIFIRHDAEDVECLRV